MMNTTDTTKAKTCWRCRKCGFTTPLGKDICSNPSCRADLSLYGEPFTPAAQQEPTREEKQKANPQRDSKRPSSSNLWEEEPEQPETEEDGKTARKHTKKISRKEKKARKKQQAAAHAQEAAVQRSRYNRSPVKTFFLSVLAILISLIAAALAVAILSGGIMLWHPHWEWQYLSYILMWHQVIPGIGLLILTAIFTRIALKEKNERKIMYTTIAFWAIPFVASCWRGFLYDDGLYLLLLFLAEPVLAVSIFAGIKGLKRASSLLRWIAILLLIAAGIIAVLLTIDPYFFSHPPGASYGDSVLRLLSVLLYLGTHFGVAFVLFRWGPKHF